MQLRVAVSLRKALMPMSPLPPWWFGQTKYMQTVFCVGVVRVRLKQRLMVQTKDDLKKQDNSNSSWQFQRKKLF